VIRSAIRVQGSLIDQAMSSVADAEGIRELGHQQAKEIVQSMASLTLSTLRNEFAITQEVKQIETLVRQEASLRLELYTSKETLLQTGERYKSLLAQGQRLLEERLAFRQKTAANVQQMRYKDMAFRISEMTPWRSSGPSSMWPPPGSTWPRAPMTTKPAGPATAAREPAPFQVIGFWRPS